MALLARVRRMAGRQNEPAHRQQYRFSELVGTIASILRQPYVDLVAKLIDAPRKDNQLMAAAKFLRS